MYQGGAFQYESETKTKCMYITVKNQRAWTSF
jgi:hypothetical protein